MTIESSHVTIANSDIRFLLNEFIRQKLMVSHFHVTNGRMPLVGGDTIGRFNYVLKQCKRFFQESNIPVDVVRYCESDNYLFKQRQVNEKLKIIGLSKKLRPNCQFIIIEDISISMTSIFSYCIYKFKF